MKKYAKTIGTVTLSVALAFGLFKLTESPAKHTTIVTEATTDAPPAHFAALPMVPPGAGQDFTEAVDKSLNTVVHITSEYEGSTTSSDPLRDFLFGNPGSGPSLAAGSGVIISDDGYIITNNHVIEDADKLSVSLGDKREFTAEIIGTDPSTDLALIKVNATNLPHITFGNSDEVAVGQWVLALGNPFNLNNTVTAGIVSAKGRNINLLQYNPDKDVFPLESFIQTDAAVNPGNSGGALINTNGDLIGINTAIASQTGSYAGYSFAVPVNIVRKVSNDLLEFGKVQRAFIGVSIRDIDQTIAKEYELDNMNGVFVADLTAGGAAAEAGIRPGDIITHVGTVKVDEVSALQEQVARFRPGNQIAVTIQRNGNPKVMNMTLRNAEGKTDIIRKETASNTSDKEAMVIEALGATFSDITESQADALNIEDGVQVDEITGGKLRGSGIRDGFIITKLDKKEVTSAKELISLLESKDGGVLIEGVYPNGMKGFYGFGM